MGGVEEGWRPYLSVEIFSGHIQDACLLTGNKEPGETYSSDSFWLPPQAWIVLQPGDWVMKGPAQIDGTARILISIGPDPIVARDGGSCAACKNPGACFCGQFR